MQINPATNPRIRILENAGKSHRTWSSPWTRPARPATGPATRSSSSTLYSVLLRVSTSLYLHSYKYRSSIFPVKRNNFFCSLIHFVKILLLVTKQNLFIFLSSLVIFFFIHTLWLYVVIGCIVTRVISSHFLLSTCDVFFYILPENI